MSQVDLSTSTTTFGTLGECNLDSLLTSYLNYTEFTVSLVLNGCVQLWLCSSKGAPVYPLLTSSRTMLACVCSLF